MKPIVTLTALALLLSVGAAFASARLATNSQAGIPALDPMTTYAQVMVLS
jgi:hypothetical protein